MFDLGWQELLLLSIVAIVVVGPKDLPRFIRQVSGWIKQVRSVARDFQSTMEEAAREAEIDEIRKSVNEIKDNKLTERLKEEFDADGELTSAAADLEKSARDAAEVVNKETSEPVIGETPVSEPAPAPEPVAASTSVPQTDLPGFGPTAPASPPVETASDISSDPNEARPKTAAAGAGEA